ncbi:hypothetical protein [cyanobacterium endosymbiont of Rhopalodia gibberula]|uniref:hypothetical protein n=1 Tax=cyanobacterium endosymbiont of Rhopalodia gibberula TaxID=1763363 RepID=UPI000E652B9D|nr:hypothetical protein [cyanobacterium endosymbiont of Rhopalodia gibberula]
MVTSALNYSVYYLRTKSKLLGKLGITSLLFVIWLKPVLHEICAVEPTAGMEQILFSHYLNCFKHHHSLLNCFLSKREINFLHGQIA